MKLSLPACFGWFFCMAMLSASAGQVVVETDVGKSIGQVKPANLRESYPVWHFPISRPHAGPVLGNTSTGLML